ncbi:DUF6931 family protein [Endozoicomonadaceae bacterium StTr2]
MVHVVSGPPIDLAQLRGQWHGKFMSRSSRKLSSDAALKKKATDLLEDEDLEPEAFIAGLLQQKLTEECIAFLAVALPPRESLYWAICCFDSMPRQREEDIQHAFAAARSWVNQPCEATRRHAGKMARKAGLKTPEGWLAQAAFWSGGSILPADKPFVAPPEGVYSKAVNSALKLLVGHLMLNKPRVQREQIKPVLQMSFVQAGLAVARGEKLR